MGVPSDVLATVLEEAGGGGGGLGFLTDPAEIPFERRAASYGPNGVAPLFTVPDIVVPNNHVVWGFGQCSVRRENSTDTQVSRLFFLAQRDNVGNFTAQDAGFYAPGESFNLIPDDITLVGTDLSLICQNSSGMDSMYFDVAGSLVVMPAGTTIPDLA